MRIAFLINELETEDPRYTTTRLARAAAGRGHEVTYIGVDDFNYDVGDHLSANGRVTTSPGASRNGFLEELRSTEPQSVDLDTLDVLMLRNDPAQDQERPWAQALGTIFGDLLATRGVLVLNDPGGLAKALNKLYLQAFPRELRAETLVSRNVDAIKEFIADHRGAVLKPLQGSGGQSVFRVHPDEDANLNQMIDAVMRDGYVVAQEFLPEAAEGDLRLFLMNGKPLQEGSAYAAFRRVSEGEDLRTNMSAGGRSVPAEVNEGALVIAEMVRPKLIADGMFLVGLDIAGDKLLEVNVFSPGGIGSASEFSGIDFSEVIVGAVEAKLESKIGGTLSNAQLATLSPD